MNEKGSSKATNSEIVKALIVITQDFYENYKPDEGYSITISEANIVGRISYVMRTFQRQQDRITDILDSMQKIISGS